MSATHQTNLRTIAGSKVVHLTPTQREALYAAADHMDQLEANNRMLNRITTIDHQQVESEQISEIKQRLAALESKVVNFVGIEMTIEQVLKQWGVINGNGTVTR